MVAEGLAPSRSQAQALILAGRILVDDTPVTKAGQRVREDASLRLRGEARRYVSRGGEKLEGALRDLGVDPSGKRCLDLGSSTGGFTDCLLQHGAASVIAVDVGTNQLDLRLRRDERVHVFERTNARHLTPDALPHRAELVTIDVSFVSARHLLPRLPELAPGAPVLVMVKPQFELEPGQVGKGGVVRDDALRAEAVQRLVEAAEALGYACAGQADSVLAGPKGNREVFVLLTWMGA